MRIPTFTIMQKTLVILPIILCCFLSHTYAQQFNSDNQWVSSHGVGTLTGTAGTEYSQLYLTAALFPEWEFNAQFTYYYDDPRVNSNFYSVTTLFAKRRLWQNERETAGYSVMGGVGLFPGHIEEGTAISPLRSWWLLTTSTFAFNNDKILWDIIPGAMVNLDEEQKGETAWGFTYSTRLALYDIIPKTALVGEVFGTAGEAESTPAYRAGCRWENPKLVVSLTYAGKFDGAKGAGLELGFMYFTDSIFCFGGCNK